MSTKLEQLLESISHERTLDDVSRLTDDALNALPIRDAQITDWEAFRRALIQCMQHVEDSVLRRTPVGATRRADLDFEWGRCCHVLTQLYGPNGEKAAFERARTGNEGGLRQVIRDFARRTAEDTAQNEIRAKVGNWWLELSVDEQLAVADEYLRRFGHLLPSELTERSAARIRANMPQVLEQHPRLMQPLARVGRG